MEGPASLQVICCCITSFTLTCQQCCMQQNCICSKRSLFIYLSFAEIYDIKSSGGWKVDCVCMCCILFRLTCLPFTACTARTRCLPARVYYCFPCVTTLSGITGSFQSKWDRFQRPALRADLTEPRNITKDERPQGCVRGETRGGNK